MNDADIEVIVTDLLGWEGAEPGGIRDTTPQGWFTVGAGWKCGSVREAQALTLPDGVTTAWRNETAGRLATPDEVAAEYQRVMALAPGRLPAFYRATRPPVIQVPVEVIRDVTRHKLITEFLPAIPGAGFPSFGGYPLTARRGIVDIAWNEGLGAPAHGGKGPTGLRGFVHLALACEAGNWGRAPLGGPYPPGSAAAEAHRPEPPTRHARNVWCQGMFAAAAAG